MPIIKKKAKKVTKKKQKKDEMLSKQDTFCSTGALTEKPSSTPIIDQPIYKEAPSKSCDLATTFVPHPLTLCFQSDNAGFTHLFVLNMVKQRLVTVPQGRVTLLQFVPRSISNPKSKMKDLWLMTVNSPEAKKELLRGLIYNKKHFTIRTYDDVLFEQQKHKEQVNNITRMIKTIGLRKDGTSKAMTKEERHALSELLVKQHEKTKAMLGKQK